MIYPSSSPFRVSTLASPVSLACVYVLMLVMICATAVAQVSPDEESGTSVPTPANERDVSQLYGTWVLDADATAALGEMGTADEIRREFGEITFRFNADGTGVMVGEEFGETLRIPYTFEATRRDARTVIVQVAMSQDAFTDAELVIQFDESDEFATFRSGGEQSIILTRQSGALGPGQGGPFDGMAQLHPSVPEPQPGVPVEVATASLLYGVWLLDVNAMLEEMPPEERASATSFMRAIEVTVTFDDNGTITVESSVFGETEVERGTFDIRATQGASLTLEVTAEGEDPTEMIVYFHGEDMITLQEGDVSENLHFYRAP